MQLHFGCKRNVNTVMLNKAGINCGCDTITGAFDIVTPLAGYMDELNSEGLLPKMIIYSLNPVDNALIGTLIGCFQDSTVPGKIQQGSGWWFNDNKTGMEEQMISLANLGLLGNFIGMLTDSRSFLSYPRHEYFRRIACNLIGDWVESGQYPNYEPALQKIVEGISYRNAVRYFEL